MRFTTYLAILRRPWRDTNKVRDKKPNGDGDNNGNDGAFHGYDCVADP
jgi:hypothetical protein